MVEEKNNKFRVAALAIGAMFILATVTAILSMFNIGALLEPSELLDNLQENEIKVVISVILELVLAVCVMGIGFVMYPILKKQNEGLAAGYMVLRIVEGLLIIIASIGLISLFTLSKEYSSGAWDASAFEPLGVLLLSIREWSFIIGTLIFLGLGGMVMNYQVFRIKLVPRWLSGWGFIGASLAVVYGIFSLFGYDPSFLAIAIGFQEMVFAGWIIIKGFDLPKSTAGSDPLYN
jgi:hypothetical protein